MVMPGAQPSDSQLLFFAEEEPPVGGSGLSVKSRAMDVGGYLADENSERQAGGWCHSCSV
jgi:hypothetical protein